MASGHTKQVQMLLLLLLSLKSSIFFLLTKRSQLPPLFVWVTQGTCARLKVVCAKYFEVLV